MEYFGHKNSIEIINLTLDKKGNINLDELRTFLSQDIKTLVTLMHANNEISTLIPLKEVSLLCREFGAYLHSDTVQTMGHYPFDLVDLDIDFITCAAHKFHGPKGIGFLYVNKNTKIAPFIHGGSQERGMRGGTENLVGIVGLVTALDLANQDIEAHQKHVQGIKSHMIKELREIFPDISFHGEIEEDKSLYTVLNVCFPRTDKSAMLLFTLDLKGVAVSGGSACTSGAAKGSHVLEGIDADMTKPNVRFSFSRYTTIQEVDFALEQIKVIYDRILV